ncbi:hypothetical protein BDZ89DRAFT_1074160 [Hymenopellis radicata]|nr:hypothetical protein BDZ89DRAFT_1074160 [Hymenopellis radicata]
MSRPSEPSSSKSLFFVYAPYEKRIAAQPAHLSAEEKRLSGIAEFAGIVLSDESEEPTEPKRMLGSVMICEAENVEEVREKIKADIYLSEGVWRAETLVILPFHSTMLPCKHS